ncbi:MAG: SDR family NAD(P)-dependent oxidoreductase, partial [Steroidobacteraceae bacterium]
MELEGRVAAISGATGSIGRGIAMRFARAGAQLALIDEDVVEGAALARKIATTGGKCRFIRADFAAR